MKAILKMQPGKFEDLMGHLLPPGSWREEAAFLFVTSHKSGERISFEVLETALLAPQEFDSQAGTWNWRTRPGRG